MERIRATLLSFLSRSKSVTLRLPTSAFIGAYLLVLSSLAGAAAYYLMFTGFTVYDDEGTMMMTVKEYLSGARPYDDFWSEYGPAYYFYNWLIRFGSATNVTHDAVRMTSAVLWVACSLLCALIVLRLTKSLALAAAAHVLTFGTLRFFRTEPGHPQELCTLLLIGLVACSLLMAKPGIRTVTTIAIGAAAAGLLLVKANIGVFAIVAVSLAAAFQLPASILSRTLRIALASAALVLPFVLMRQHLDDPSTRVYWFVVTASIAGLLPGLVLASKTPSLSLHDIWIVVVAFVLTVIVFWLDLTVRGVSSYSVLDSLVLSPMKLANQEFWYRPLSLGPVWAPWALGGCVSAAFLTRTIGRGAERPYRLLALIKVIFGGSALVLAAVWPETLVGFVTPYCWLILYPQSRAPKVYEVFPRTLLGTTAVLQTLYTYPLAGSQSALILVFLILVAVVAIGDFLSEAASYRVPAASGLGIRVLAVGALIFLPLYYVRLALQREQVYRSLPSLGLSGAEEIHLPQQQALEYQWLTRNLKDYCDAFVGLPGIPSLYFWTGQNSPGRLDVGAWTVVLDDTWQLKVISALSGQMGGYYFAVRKDRRSSPNPSP